MERSFKSAFSGGEVTSEMFGRIDDSKYQSGLAKCRNFVLKPHGPAENRAGFQFVREVKDSTKRTRLIPFTFSSTQTMVLEFSPTKIRFHTMGGTVLNTGVPYEVTTPYAEGDLFDLHYVQSADVLTICHPSHPPKELRRLGATNWTLTDIAFNAGISAPSGLTVTSLGHTTNKYTYTYVVTAIAADGVSESVASGEASDDGNLFETGGTVEISWTAVSGASKYNVYKLQGGLFGFIGQTTGTSIVDDNIAADLSKTPPIYESVFGSSGNYPAAPTYFDQRRTFAGTANNPQTLWMTKSGTESNMSYSFPIKDDDRIKYTINAREASSIRHIIPLDQMVILTSSAEFRVRALNNDAITPASFSVRPQSYVGASNVQPAVINNTLIYAAARGGHVREMAYNWQASGFVTGDLSLRAPHLFDGYEIVDMAYSKAPMPIVWFVSSNGTLLGLTYVPEQQVGGWHWHDTDGVFESCCVVAEEKEDVLYVVVRRTINGVQKRYVERQASRAFPTQQDAFFVDSGLTYSGSAVTTISGLGHLEGKTVSILADGAVHPRRTVTSGAITLDAPCSKVQVGLPIVADIQTLPFAAQVDNAFGQGKLKNVNAVTMRVFKSSGIFAGPSFDKLKEVKQRTTEPLGSPVALKSQEFSLDITPSWGDSGQVCIRQADPLPLTLVSMTIDTTLGG